MKFITDVLLKDEELKIRQESILQNYDYNK